VTQITAAITNRRNAIIKTRTIGFTWLAWSAPDGTKVLQAWINAAGSWATMPTVMMIDIPLPTPRSVI
jgi:hypothetical protein